MLLSPLRNPQPQKKTNRNENQKANSRNQFYLSYPTISLRNHFLFLASAMMEALTAIIGDTTGGISI
jgi:hypothetical protein